MTDYSTFLQSKIDIARESGFAVTPGAVNPALKPHLREADEQISSPTLLDLLGIGD